MRELNRRLDQSDPIGVYRDADQPRPGEYDCLVAPTFGLLRNGATASAITAVLARARCRTRSGVPERHAPPVLERHPRLGRPEADVAHVAGEDRGGEPDEPRRRVVVRAERDLAGGPAGQDVERAVVSELHRRAQLCCPRIARRDPGEPRTPARVVLEHEVRDALAQRRQRPGQSLTHRQVRCLRPVHAVLLQASLAAHGPSAPRERRASLRCAPGLAQSWVLGKALLRSRRSGQANLR